MNARLLLDAIYTFDRNNGRQISSNQVKIQLGLGTFTNSSAEVRSISLLCCMPKRITGEYDLPQDQQQRLFIFFTTEGQEIRAGFNKDDGMEESISRAGLGQVFQL